MEDRIIAIHPTVTMSSTAMREALPLLPLTFVPGDMRLTPTPESLRERDEVLAFAARHLTRKEIP